ncbi:MAG: ComEC/Rec2 family competence protein [Verrucomicrobiota bacterium]
MPATIFFILGILSVVGTSISESPSWQSFLPASCLAGIFALFLVTDKKFSALFFGLGIILSFIHLQIPWQNYSEKLTRPVTRMEVRGVVTEPLYGGDKLEWLRDKKNIEVQLNSMRRFSDEPWEETAGKIVLRTKKPLALEYGDVIQFRAVFKRPEQPLFKGAFNYRKYLRANGITHIAEVDDNNLVKLRGVTDWRRIPHVLFRLREKGVEILTRQLDDEQNRQIAAAMVFGYREGLSYDLKERFISSGAVHIFAISGLHVGIIAGIMMLSLQVFPVGYRSRYLLLPFCLALYVFMTGGAASATRAWMMISVWAFGKATFRPTSPLNAVAFAALVLLILNPLRLLLPGFQFSFLIVSVLLLGWRFTSQISQILDEKYYWLPARRHTRSFFISGRIRNIGLNLALGITLAWLGSAGLVAWTNQLVIPQALLVNAVIFILAWCGLFSAVLTIIAGSLFLPFLATITGAVANGVFSSLAFIAELGADSTVKTAIAFPGLGVIGLYYGLIFFALTPLCPRNWRLLPITSAVVLLISFTINLDTQNSDCEVAVFHGGDADTPALVIKPPAGDSRPILINSGDYDTGRNIASYLTSQGVSRLRLLTLESGRYGAASGARFLCKIHNPEFMLAPSRSSSRHFKTMKTEYQNKGGSLKTVNPNNSKKHGSWHLGNVQAHQIKTSEGIRTTVNLTDNPTFWTVILQAVKPGKHRVILKRNGEPVHNVSISNGLEMTVEKHAF